MKIGLLYRCMRCDTLAVKTYEGDWRVDTCTKEKQEETIKSIIRDHPNILYGIHHCSKGTVGLSIVAGIKIMKEGDR